MISEPHAVAWIAVLDRIEQNLAASLERIVEPGPTSPERSGAVWNPLALLDDHLGRLQERLVSAEASAAETDALLASAVRDLQHWFDTFGKARQRLADKVAEEQAEPEA